MHYLHSTVLNRIAAFAVSEHLLRLDKRPTVAGITPNIASRAWCYPDSHLSQDPYERWSLTRFSSLATIHMQDQVPGLGRLERTHRVSPCAWPGCMSATDCLMCSKEPSPSRSCSHVVIPDHTTTTSDSFRIPHITTITVSNTNSPMQVRYSGT